MAQASAPSGGSHCIAVFVCVTHNNPPNPPKRKTQVLRLGLSWWEGVDACNSEVWHLCIKHFAPPPKRWFMQYKVLQLHQRCSKSSSPAIRKKHRKFGAFLGGRGWIRTTEVTDNRFTVCSLWPLGNPPRWS